MKLTRPRVTPRGETVRSVHSTPPHAPNHKVRGIRVSPPSGPSAAFVACGWLLAYSATRPFRADLEGPTAVTFMISSRKAKNFVDERDFVKKSAQFSDVCT